MKAGVSQRFRRKLVPRWATRSERAVDRAMERREQSRLQEREVIDEIASEFTTEELQEFLEADLHPIQADPLFKEQLREKLWKLVQRSIHADPDPH
jgi:hypothetical protein